MADHLFRFPQAVRRDAAVEDWLASRPVALRALARQWFERMRGCGEDVRELMHDGCPVACVTDAAFAYVNVFKAHVNIGFFFGAELADPAGILEGRGRRMRHVKLRPGQAQDDAGGWRRLRGDQDQLDLGQAVGERHHRQGWREGAGIADQIEAQAEDIATGDGGQAGELFHVRDHAARRALPMSGPPP